MGNEAHGQIVAEYGSYSDTGMQDWFSERGKEMSGVTHRRHLTYHFTVLDSPVINAFAVPGGYVYVTRGIMGYFNDEAQFAGVLGHELGHVNARHTAARYSKAKLASFGIALGSIISEEFERFSQLASLGTSFLFLKFSRNDEREADKLGVEYSSAVGYDATHISMFFKTLERLQPKGGSLPAWQSTHPDPGDRINATRKMSLAYQKKHPDMRFVVKREEYLDRIDGMTYGDDPRQGYTKDNMFYHPEMKFQFPVPPGWKLTNKPAEVRLTSEEQKAILIFTLAEGANPNETSVNFARGNNVTLSSSENFTANGMSGVKTSGVLISQNQELGIASYFLKMNDNVFAFHGLVDASQLTSYVSAFENSAYGFNRLTDKSLIEVSPDKIEVRETTGKMTLEKAFNAFGVTEDERDKLAIINGMELSDKLEVGTRVKIIV
ncbi:M48 family metalloprotease [Candidatus Latescibacterota bacterium]